MIKKKKIFIISTLSVVILATAIGVTSAQINPWGMFTNKPILKARNQAPGLIKTELRMNLDGNDIDLSIDYVERLM
jgi:hypothetical protein